MREIEVYPLFEQLAHTEERLSSLANPVGGLLAVEVARQAEVELDLDRLLQQTPRLEGDTLNKHAIAL